MGKSFKRAWCFTLLSLVLSFGISLEEAERKALAGFYEIKNQVLEVRKKEIEGKEKFSSFLPTINFEASYNFAREQSFSFGFPPLVTPQEFIFIKDRFPKYTLTLSQNLFSLPAIREYRLARIEEESARELLEEKRMKTLFEVRSAYINALKAKASVEILESQLEMINAHLRDVKSMYEEGLVTFKDLLETQVKAHEVQEKLTKARASYRKALDYLSYLVGEKVEIVEEIEDGSVKILETDQEVLVQKLKNRPLLRSLAKNLEGASQMVSLAKSYFYPQIVLEAFFQRTEESDLFPKDRFMVTFALRWNIFSGLKRFRLVQKAGVGKLQVAETVRDVEKRLMLELKSVLEDIKTAEERIRLARKQLETAREQLKVAKERYSQGIGTNTEVLSAQSQLTYARQNLKMSTYDLKLFQYKLKEVIGDE